MDVSLPDNEDNDIILYLSDPSEIRASNINVIRKAEEGGYSVIIITTNFPASVLEKIYNKNGINTDNIYFIDAISAQSFGKSPENDDHHFMVSSPADLTKLGIAISEDIKRMQDKKIFVLFDSVSTLLIYLPSVKIIKFMHFLSNKLRQISLKGVFLAVDGGLDPMMMAQLSSMVDEVVKPGE